MTREQSDCRSTVPRITGDPGHLVSVDMGRTFWDGSGADAIHCRAGRGADCRSLPAHSTFLNILVLAPGMTLGNVVVFRQRISQRVVCRIGDPA